MKAKRTEPAIRVPAMHRIYKKKSQIINQTADLSEGIDEVTQEYLRKCVNPAKSDSDGLEWLEVYIKLFQKYALHGAALPVHRGENCEWVCVPL